MKQTKLIAFHGKQEIKDKYLARIREHQLADEIVKGQYWAGGKGCAVGCTIHGSDHQRYETELGIPFMLARLEDGIFESLSNGKAKAWPEQFLNAIPVSADLSMVGSQFLFWLLVDPTDGVIRFANTEKTKASIKAVADLYARRLKGDEPTYSEWSAAAAAAAAAADAAAAARWSAAAAAADAAAAARWSAAAAAADAADAAAAAARWSAAAARWSAAADAADAAPRSAAADAAADADAARIRQSEKLLELLSSAPVR